MRSPPSDTMRAAATSDRSGCPNMAALDPTSTTSPSISRMTPRFEISWCGSFQLPTTKPEEELLSAMTSASANLKFRSEEHTYELQSLMRISYDVFCLKQKNNDTKQHT